MSKNRIYDIKSFINCNTRYVIYLITCKACRVQYVGCTTGRLRDRLNDHIGNIDRKQATNVARHFNNFHGGDTSLLQIQGIEKIITPRRR